MTQMEAKRLKTLDDLEQACLEDERCELINGEIVKRPMPRSEHAIAQGRTFGELGVFDRNSGPGGWWIMTEISVQYNEHQCPCHDLAGWRKQRVPGKPEGMMKIAPDWGVKSSRRDTKRKIRCITSSPCSVIEFHIIGCCGRKTRC